MEYCGFRKETNGAREGADTLIRWLKERGYTLVIATTKQSNMEAYRTRNARMMEKARIGDYFTLVYTREDVKEIKPNPEIYLRVMPELGGSPEECLVFEDSLMGIEAAKNAGMQAAAMYDRYSDGEREQINALADYQVQSRALGAALQSVNKKDVHLIPFRIKCTPFFGFGIKLPLCGQRSCAGRFCQAAPTAPCRIIESSAESVCPDCCGSP